MTGDKLLGSYGAVYIYAGGGICLFDTRLPGTAILLARNQAHPQTLSLFKDLREKGAGTV
jgi:hypothetical protein